MPKQAKRPRKVRYAVVGAGWISQAAMMPGVQHTGNSEMTALVTGDPLKAKKLGKKYGIERTYSYEQYDEMLGSGEVDAVYLALPNEQHAEFAVRTLEAGVHLLLEKPMAVSVEQCEKILRAQQQSGAKLMVAYRLHHEPGTLTAIERVRKGEIGRVRLFNSTFSQQVAATNHRAKMGYWSGPVPDMGPYCINAVRNLFGAEPLEVFATGVVTDTKRFNFEDTVAVTLKFDEARVAAFVVSYNGGDVDDFRVVGEKGDLFSKPAYQVNKAIEHVLTVKGKEKRQKFAATDQFGSEMRYFSECILNDRDPEADGEEGMLDLRVIAAVKESLDAGKAVELQPYERRRRPRATQAVKLAPVKPPALVHAAKPSEG